MVRLSVAHASDPESVQVIVSEPIAAWITACTWSSE